MCIPFCIKFLTGDARGVFTNIYLFYPVSIFELPDTYRSFPPTYRASKKKPQRRLAKCPKKPRRLTVKILSFKYIYLWVAKLKTTRCKRQNSMVFQSEEHFHLVGKRKEMAGEQNIAKISINYSRLAFALYLIFRHWQVRNMPLKPRAPKDFARKQRKRNFFL